MKNLFQLMALVFIIFSFSCEKDESINNTNNGNNGNNNGNNTITKSSAKDITKFSFASLSPVVDATIDIANKTISATVGIEAVEKLVPAFTISDKSTVSPASGVAQDFSKEVSYTVTAEDGSTQIWKVAVKIDAANAKVCRLQTIVYSGSIGTDFYTYDDKKRLTKIEVKDSKGVVLRTQSYEYNTDGTLKSYIYAFANYSEKTSYSYSNGRRISETFSNGTSTRNSKFEYDNAGVLLKIINDNATFNYSNGKTSSIISTNGAIYTLDAMGFVIKEIGSNGFFTTYEYDKDGQRIKYENFDDKGVRFSYSIIEYSPLNLSKISEFNPQLNSKGALEAIPSYGKTITYIKRSTFYNIKNGVETKSSDVLFDYKLDNNGKIQSLTSTNNINNITTTRTYNYQECE